VAGLGRFVSPHTARLTEDENGEFVVQTSGGANFDRVRILENGIEYNRAAPPVLAGKHIDLFLRPDRFLFRPLELPNRASEFMPGIVRSQIDRLTPWNAADTAFGWSGPAEIDDGKMEITIVATPLALIRPYTQAIADIGVHSIAVFTALPEADFDKSPIKVWEQKGRGSKDVGRIRQALVVALASAGITAGVALGADVMMSIGLATQRDELSRQISGIRSAGGFGRASDAQRALGRRKHDAPLTVLVLETLAKVLPDQTHVTELQLEGNKVRLTGITRDAPSLIGLIEQSNRFTRATFFAPTTRSTSNSGDLFHIEAVIKPSRSPS
jgi:general secretion pathway protein L